MRRPTQPFNRSILTVPFGFLLLGVSIASASMHNALADSYQNFSLGGLTWHVPTQFIDHALTAKSDSNSVVLAFELPNFTPVNKNDFLGVYSRDDRPILTVRLGHDPIAGSGPSLMQIYIKEANKDCARCTVNPSSVGGTEYATFSGFLGEPLPSDGVLFRLYEYPDPGNQFSICHFDNDMAPLPCQMKEALGDTISASVEFPNEYISQGPELIKELNERLASFRTVPPASGEIIHPLTDDRTLTCWSPAPGSPGAETIPLKLGPEVWHIPRAYDATYGLDQSQDPQYDSISFFLKLPDLEPLSSSDPSPFVIRGPGNYISINIGFDGREIPSLSKSDARLGLLGQEPHYIGKNAFIDYDEYLSPISAYMYTGDIEFVSVDPSADASSFPPDSFDCDEPGAVPSPGCTFRLTEFLNSVPHIRNRAGVYDVEYDFSRDYFSQFVMINKCVKKLYEEFRFGNGV